MKKRFALIIAGIVLFLFNQHLMAAQTALVVIADASWAMSVKKGDPGPMDLLKNGISGLISSLTGSTTLLGLIICGNNGEEGCDAPLVELPPAIPNDANRHLYEEAVTNLSPQGELSLSKALNQAISTVSIMESERLIILVIGRGEEGCSFTPCEDMEKVFPSSLPLSINTISIDGESDRARAQMQCIARKGAGLWFHAGSQNELDGAIKQILANADCNLKVNISIGKGGAFPGNLNASLFRLNDTDAFQTYVGHPAFFSVPPGSYRLLLECSGNQINMVKELSGVVVPKEGIKNIDVDLDMGMVEISVTLCGNRETPEKIETRIFRSGDAGKEVGKSDLAPLTYYLPPGLYDFQMDIEHHGYKESTRLEAVSVTTGKRTYRTLSLNLGELAITAYENQDHLYQGPARINIYPSGVTNAPILSTNLYPKSLYLPPGTYDLFFDIGTQASQGGVWKKGIPIVAGEKTSEFINLALGELKCSIHAITSDEASLLVKTRIRRSGTDGEIVQETDQNPFTLLLPAGKYDILTEYNGTIGTTTAIEKDILVLPGRSVEKQINLGLKRFEIAFYSEENIDISEFVSTTLYKKGALDHPLTIIKSGPVSMVLPMGEYDLKFDVSTDKKQKVFWRKNVTITEEPIQSFSVSFPGF